MREARREKSDAGAGLTGTLSSLTGATTLLLPRSTLTPSGSGAGQGLRHLLAPSAMMKAVVVVVVVVAVVVVVVRPPGP